MLINAYRDNDFDVDTKADFLSIAMLINLKTKESAVGIKFK